MTTIVSVTSADTGHEVEFSDGRKSFIPDDPLNHDRRTLDDWLAVPGNTADPLPPRPDPEPSDLAILTEALLNDASLINQGHMTAARNRLRSQGP